MCVLDAKWDQTTKFCEVPKHKPLEVARVCGSSQNSEIKAHEN